MLFGDIDVMIQDHTHYNPETRENEKEYLNLRGELNDYFADDLEYDQLSPDAQQVLANWEDAMAELCAKVNYDEQPEHF